MPNHTVPLVGMHFRPPARAILRVLPSGCPLRIIPEPDNPYDANALAVHVASGDIPTLAHDDLAQIASPFGFDLPTILSAPEWHLGYVKATEALWLREKIAFAMLQGKSEAEDGVDAFYPGRLSFDSAGKPTVSVDL